MNLPLISIIIPIFNRENTISVCIDSVLNLNYPNFELILIDDGSNDNSKTICQNYKNKYSNIIFFCQENKGVSTARNKGIELAKGKWITFIDSDDAVLPYHLDIVEKEHNMADLLMVNSCSAQIINDNIKPIDNTIENQRIYSKDATNYLMSKKFNPFSHSFYSIWDKFFKAEIIKNNNIHFDETISLGEDQIFVCNYLCYANTLMHYTRPSYVRLQWENIEHLGSKLRMPEDYLYNQINNYKALIKLNKIKGGELTEHYSINYGIDRPITRIIYNFALGNFKELINKTDFNYFIKNKLNPFLSSIDIHKYNAINFDVRFSRYLLLNHGLTVTLLWIKIYMKHIKPILGLMQLIIIKIKNR